MPKRVAFIRASRESRFLSADDPRIVQLLEEFSTRSFKVTGYIEELRTSLYSIRKDNMG